MLLREAIAGEKIDLREFIASDAFDVRQHGVRRAIGLEFLLVSDVVQRVETLGKEDRPIS